MTIGDVNLKLTSSRASNSSCFVVPWSKCTDIGTCHIMPISNKILVFIPDNLASFFSGCRVSSFLFHS